MNVCGVEEAGRGPVIGPMVMAGVAMEASEHEKLANLGVKDSKLLTPRQREELYEKIIKIAAYEIVILSPQQIDDALGDANLNLNWLEALTTADILNKLKPEQAILDCPSNNTLAYRDYVKRHLKEKMDVLAEHKADANHVIVGAASILAKVTRDREIEKIKKEVNNNFGSGYMTDPKTQEFIIKHYRVHPEIFRKSWESYKKLVRKEGQKKIEEF